MELWDEKDGQGSIRIHLNLAIYSSRGQSLRGTNCNSFDCTRGVPKRNWLRPRTEGGHTFTIQVYLFPSTFSCKGSRRVLKDLSIPGGGLRLLLGSVRRSRVGSALATFSQY